MNYFTFRYDRGFSWYCGLFEKNADAQYALDASPQYLHHDEAPQRINSDVPDAILVCILRDPIDRAISNYRYNVSRGLQDPRESFDDTVRTNRGEHIYLRKGLYARQLRKFPDFFAAGRMWLIDFDDMKSAPRDTTESLCLALGLDPALLPPSFDRISNKTVETGGIGAQLIYRAMSLKSRFSKTYDAMPRWVHMAMRGLKAAVANRATVAGTRIDLSADTERFLIDYFAEDIRAMTDEFQVQPRWIQRYKTPDRAVSGESS